VPRFDVAIRRAAKEGKRKEGKRKSAGWGRHESGCFCASIIHKQRGGVFSFRVLHHSFTSHGGVHCLIIILALLVAEILIQNRARPLLSPPCHFLLFLICALPEVAPTFLFYCPPLIDPDRNESSRKLSPILSNIRLERQRSKEPYFQHKGMQQFEHACTAGCIVHYLQAFIKVKANEYILIPMK